jgi:hypothetical protein
MSPELKKIFLTLMVLAMIGWFIYPVMKKQNSIQSTNDVNNTNNDVDMNNDTEMFDSVSSDFKETGVPLPEQPAINSTQPHNYEQTLALATSASEFIGMPKIILPAWGEDGLSYGQADTLDNGLGQIGFGSNMCSKSCCTPQYPPPFVQDQDPFVCKSKDKFVSSNYTCNNGWQNSGCLCLTEAQSDFLGSRGENNWSDTNEI